MNETLLDVDTEKLSNDIKYAEKIENKLRGELEKGENPSNSLKYMQILALKASYSSPGYEQSRDYQSAKQYIPNYLFEMESVGQQSIVRVQTDGE